MNKIQHFMIDPPWPMKIGFGEEYFHHYQGLNYKVISVEDIFKLLDRKILIRAAKQHHVYLWTMERFLRVTEDEMEKRGYRRHLRIIWDKKDGVPVGTLRIHHEYMIWFYKPKIISVCKESKNKFCTVMRESTRQSSRKPEAAYTLIERLFPNQTYMDVFSRQPRQGWYQFGNQKNHFPEFEKQIRL